METVNYEVRPGDNLWNLWEEYAASDITNAQKVEMEAMVRANPEMFGIDSNNPDLILVGEEINLQAMFDQAQANGIVSPEQNPGVGILTTETTPETNTVFEAPDATPVNPTMIESVERSMDEIYTDPVEGVIESVVDSQIQLTGSLGDMADQMEDFFQTNTINLPYSDVQPFISERLSQDIYELIRSNILETSGGDDVFVKSVGIASQDTAFSQAGDQLITFTDSSDPTDATRFVYNLDQGQFDTELSYRESPSLLASLLGGIFGNRA